jgi:hypothetical protein
VNKRRECMRKIERARMRDRGSEVAIDCARITEWESSKTNKHLERGELKWKWRDVRKRNPDERG